MIHLDTTFLVDLPRESHRRPGPAIAFLSSLEEQELAISVRYPEAEFPKVYGDLLATLQRSGQAISAIDLLIASSALLEKAALVTRNRKHFTRVPGLEALSY